MTTSSCRKLTGAAVFAAALLSGCAASVTGPDRASLRVEGARVTVVAPEGLCIDPESPDVARAGGYLLIGECSLFDTSAEAGRALPGVITVSISSGGLPGDLDQLEAFLTGPGLAGLSRTADAGTVRVLDRRRTDNALFLKLADSSPARAGGADEDYWRVFFPAGPRLVTGALVPFSDARISDGTALSLLSALEVNTAAANPRPPAPAAEPAAPDAG
ncbi:hypothetical protein HMH01_02105 [Halovulum dunhuangense]|uniref:Uncharacterized protein n=1 Tax=Halovulum dunhuangense TaxID=1505036 RepID=A0A849KUE7_9RHOB|nr:hypothetical protein [Halovulum dunhuangense]NNU79221.1 hypothetical protein [Halovulum dunhuangense]